MRVLWLGSWLVFASCNRLLGLDATTEVDSPLPIDGAPDAFMLVTPPATNPPCGARVPVETWMQQAGAAADGVFGTAFYRVGAGSDRMMLSIGKRIYDWDLVAPPVAIASLDAATPYGALGLSPDADVLWVAEGPDLFYATRASGWAKTPATFGFQNQIVSPSNVVFYGGAARMALVVSTGTTQARLVEVSSPDGLQWTPVDTITFVPGDVGYATLSPDGCFVLFTGLSGGVVSKASVAFRDPDGVFRTPPTMIPSPSGVNRYMPALMTDLSALWFLDIDSNGSQHFTVLKP